MSNESQSDAAKSTGLNSGSATDATPPISTFRKGPITKVLAVAVILLIAGFVFLGPLDGVNWLTHSFNPKLVPVTGEVFFNGEPLSNAEITTQPLRRGLRGANGVSDEKGRFKLITDVDGEFVEGAYVGQHRVAVIRRHDVITFGPAPALTPQKYTAFGTSPLQIDIGNGQAIELRLEGEASKAPRPMPTMTQRAPELDENGYPKKNKSKKKKADAENRADSETKQDSENKSDSENKAGAETKQDSEKK